jgi:hypothetical protein
MKRLSTWLAVAAVVTALGGCDPVAIPIENTMPLKTAGIDLTHYWAVSGTSTRRYVQMPSSITIHGESELIKATIRKGPEGYNLLRWSVPGTDLVTIVDEYDDEVTGYVEDGSLIKIKSLGKLGEVTVVVKNYNEAGKPSGLAAEFTAKLPLMAPEGFTQGDPPPPAAGGGIYFR